MFSMVGIPPTVGFYASRGAAIASTAGYLSVAVVAVLFSVVGAFLLPRLVSLSIRGGRRHGGHRAGSDVKSTHDAERRAILLFGIMAAAFNGAVPVFDTGIVVGAFR